jgi:hypothetical protein
MEMVGQEYVEINTQPASSTQIDLHTPTEQARITEDRVGSRRYALNRNRG